MSNEDFVFPEKKNLDEREVVVGVVDTPEQEIGRLNVVTDRYIREGYLQGIPFANINEDPTKITQAGGLQFLEDSLEKDLFKKFLDTGMLLQFKSNYRFYFDKYHWQSIHFVAQTRDGYVGSARLIFNNRDNTEPSFDLPIFTDKKIKINEAWRPRIKDISSEFSQFAKTKESIPTVPVALLRIAAQYSRNHNIKEWLATTDNSVLRLLNGWIFNFKLPKLGPSVNYLGSESTPVLIEIEDTIKNALQEKNGKKMAMFLSGEHDVEGFEWYTGP